MTSGLRTHVPAASARRVPSTPDARAPSAPVRPKPARVRTASRRRSKRACLFIAPASGRALRAAWAGPESFPSRATQAIPRAGSQCSKPARRRCCPSCRRFPTPCARGSRGSLPPPRPPRPRPIARAAARRPSTSRAAARSRAVAHCPSPSSARCCSSPGVLNLWALNRNGWANDYYSAAVRSMSSSWHDFLYGSFDPSGLMTVDKPPLALWVQALSVRVFGFHSWSMLVPQALMGVATVALVYDLTRRLFGRTAGFVAGLVLALTPITVAISRHNNPDALLALCCVAALWCLVRALQDGRTRWLVARGRVRRARLRDEDGRRAARRARRSRRRGCGSPRAAASRRCASCWPAAPRWSSSGGAWPLLMMLTPGVDRPWISGTSDNSILVADPRTTTASGGSTARPAGPQITGGGGPGGGTTFGGATGPLRLFNEGLGGQAGWLLGFAVVAIVALAAVTRLRRADARTGWLIATGGDFLTTAVAFSFAQGHLPPLLRRPAGALHGDARRRRGGLVPVRPSRSRSRRGRRARRRGRDRAARAAQAARPARRGCPPSCSSAAR